MCTGKNKKSTKIKTSNYLNKELIGRLLSLLICMYNSALSKCSTHETAAVTSAVICRGLHCAAVAVNTIALFAIHKSQQMNARLSAVNAAATRANIAVEENRVVRCIYKNVSRVFQVNT